ncbi:MAG: FprA family A-type flavoprotein, partial [Firmicutes bacterium]|nr:FprA family A-type flavoprotein [Bacillota bacterium]
PTVGAFLTYLKGLRPKKKIGFAFGSYGWGGQGAKEVTQAMHTMGWETPLEFINIQYNPDIEELEAAREAGRKLGEVI